jgi:hypothetical protein
VVTRGRRKRRKIATRPGRLARAAEKRQQIRTFRRQRLGTTVAHLSPVRTISEQAPLSQPLPPLQVRVLGPDCAPLSAADIRRLFRGRRLTPARRDRLSLSGRIVAACGSRIVGVVAYDPADGELRVHEFGIDAQQALCAEEQVVNALFDALEAACLAGGGRRLVVLPRAVVAPNVLRRRGFVTIAEGCAGSWFEKTFSA